MPELETVYIIRADIFYKIGKTTDFPQRLKSMQTGNPYILEPLKLFKTEDGRDLEAFLHNRLNKYHFRGEWFILPGLDEVIELVAEYEQNRVIWNTTDPIRLRELKPKREKQEKIEKHTKIVHEIMSMHISIPEKKLLLAKSPVHIEDDGGIYINILKEYGIDYERWKRIDLRKYKITL